MPLRCTQGALSTSSPSVGIVEGPDPDLRRARRIDQPFADRPPHHRAMVDPPRIVGPQVAVRVHLDQRQRPVLRRMRPEQRPGDEMVAAERQQLRARRDHLRRRRLDRRRHARRMVRVDQAVAAVHHRQRLEQVEPERETPSARPAAPTPPGSPAAPAGSPAGRSPRRRRETPSPPRRRRRGRACSAAAGTTAPRHRSSRPSASRIPSARNAASPASVTAHAPPHLPRRDPDPERDDGDDDGRQRVDVGADPEPHLGEDHHRQRRGARAR